MVWLILLLTFILRLINLKQSLWWDEAINVVYAKSSSFWWFLTKYPIGDFHPPGWFAIVWVWGHIFGFSEIAIRLPSVILGTATVWITFLLGKELFGKKAGIVAALFLAISPLHVYYSQEARMYIFAAFSVVLSFYLLIGVLKKRRWFKLGYLISLIAVLSSDYLAYFIIPTQIIYLLWVGRFNKMFLVSLLTSALVFLPWLSIFSVQLATGTNKASALPIWTTVVGSTLKDLFLIPPKIFFGRTTFLNKDLYTMAAVFVGTLYGSTFTLGLKKFDQTSKLLISWIFIPVSLAFLISFFIPVLSYFRMLFILPAFYLVLGKGVESLPKKFVIPVFMFICAVSLVSLTGYYLDSRFQREDWRGAVSFVSKYLDDRTLIVFENNEIPAPVRYYGKDLSNFKPGLSEHLVDSLEGKTRVFLFEYLVDVYDSKRKVEQELKNFSFIQEKTYDFHGVGFIKLYVK